MLQTSLVRTVARDCLVMVETNRYSVPAAYVGQRVEVQWGPGETVQLYHRGTLIATHRRVRGQHECGVEPAHYAALRRPAPSPGDTDMRLASWTGPFPDGEVRPLAWYEAVVRQEVGHD